MALILLALLPLSNSMKNIRNLFSSSKKDTVIAPVAGDHSVKDNLACVEHVDCESSVCIEKTCKYAISLVVMRKGGSPLFATDQMVDEIFSLSKDKPHNLKSVSFNVLYPNGDSFTKLTNKKGKETEEGEKAIIDSKAKALQRLKIGPAPRTASFELTKEQWTKEYIRKITYHVYDAADKTAPSVMIRIKAKAADKTIIGQVVILPQKEPAPSARHRA